jgi:hypothetical protein
MAFDGGTNICRNGMLYMSSMGFEVFLLIVQRKRPFCLRYENSSVGRNRLADGTLFG